MSNGKYFDNNIRETLICLYLSNEHATIQGNEQICCIVTQLYDESSNTLRRLDI